MQTRFSPKAIAIGGGIAAFAIVAAIVGMRVADSRTERIEDLPPLVTVAPVTRGPVSSLVSISGTISARNELALGIDGEGGGISAVNVEVACWRASPGASLRSLKVAWRRTRRPRRALRDG